MRNVIGQRRRKDLRVYRWYSLKYSHKPLGTTTELLLHGLVALIQQPIDCGHHSDNLFFGYLLAARHSIVRIVILCRCFNQLTLAEEQSSVLRTADTFPSRKRHQVKTHLSVVPKIRDRRHVSSSIIEARYTVLVRYGDPVFAADLTALRRIEEMSHHRLICESPVVLVQRFDFNHFGAARDQSLVVSVPMRLLNNYFILRTHDLLGNGSNFTPIGNSEAGSRSQRQSGGSAGCDERSFAFQLAS